MTVNVTFLCSGGGGNLKLLYALVQLGALPSLAVSGVIVDRECPAVDWARSHGIRNQAVDYTRSQRAALHDALVAFAPDLVVTTVHKILDQDLVARYDGRLVNLHYSLLPAFAGAIGMEPVRLARVRGCRLVGATAHRVTADVDAGPILAQACVNDDPTLPEEALHNAVFRCGGVALAAAVESLVNGSVRRTGGNLRVGDLRVFAAPLPGAAVCRILREQQFWESLR